MRKSEQKSQSLNAVIKAVNLVERSKIRYFNVVYHNAKTAYDFTYFAPDATQVDNSELTKVCLTLYKLRQYIDYIELRTMDGDTYIFDRDDFYISPCIASFISSIH